MRLYKRNSVWWVDFSVNGQRYRQSLDTTDRRKAKGLANKRIADAEQGKITPAGVTFSRLAFGEAAERYLLGRKLELASSSHTKERQLLVKLREFFQASSLNRISAEQVLGYRDWRSSQGVGPAIINMEIGVLRRILKRAKRWHVIADEITPLKEPRSIGRALTSDQKLKLLETAAQKPEWETAYWAAVLALNTTMRGCELKGLRWADVDLFERVVTIGKSKTAAGERVIPLTPEAYGIFVQLRRRAELFSTVDDSHFVFGRFRVTGGFDDNKLVETHFGGYDPTQAVGSWKKAWRNLTKKAGLPGLRFHDLRHHAITELAESGISDQTIMAIAGHVSKRMLDRYSHIRLESKRVAIEALSRRIQGSYGTKDGTKAEEVRLYSDLTPRKEMVGACGFEPQTPTVSR